MSHVHEIEKLLLTDLSATTVPHISIAQPSPLEHQNFGELGVLLTITAPDNLRHEIAVIITETLKDRYYHGSELNAEAAFESALTEVNRKLHTLLAEGVTGWLPAFSGVAFAVKGDQLLLSIVGRIVAQLFRGSRIQDVAGTPGAERSVNPLKIFSSVIVGKLNPGDSVLFATPSLLDYYSLEKLKRLITIEARGETLAILESQLASETDRHAFGAVLLTVRDALAGATPGLPIANPRSTQPEASMDRLIAQEARTSAFLTPSFRTAFGEWVRRFATTSSNTIRKLVFRKPPRRRAPRPASALSEVMLRPPRIEHQRTTAPTVVDRGLAAISSGFAAARQALARVFGSLRQVEPPNPVMVRDHLANLPRRTERRTNRFLRRIAAWPRNQQILAAVAVILLVIFAQSIVSLGSAKTTRLSKAQQLALYTDARQNVDAASAALTYGDEHGAATKLAAAQADLSKLPKKPKIAVADLAKLRADLAADFDRTQHKRHIDTPELLTDLSTKAPGTPSFLLNFPTVATAGEVGTGQLGVLNRSSKALTILDANVPDSGSWNFAATEATTTGIIYTSKNTLLRFTVKDHSFAPVSPTLPNGIDVHGITTFQSRLYLLDTAGNRILRVTRAGTTYTGATNWITDPSVDLKNGASIAVDGSVYVLRSNGTISTFFQGKSTALDFAPLDPPLAAPTKIWTDGTAKHIYVLDPPHHRLVVFDKQGGLTEQMLLPDSLALTDFSVNETAKEALLLSGTKIFKVVLDY